MYVQECGFYPLNPTGHKAVDHPEHYLDPAVLPETIGTGMNSEEAEECANKDTKSFQIDHSFQGDAQRRNLDTFHRLTDRSHPAISAHLVDKKLERRKREELPAEVKKMLKAPEIEIK